jgi:hypothetical protein
MILAATISVIACHAETEKQADACGKHDSQCNRKALLTPNKQRHKGSPKRAKPYSSDGKGAPERHEVRRGCIDTKAPEQTQIRRFIIAAPHASIGQDCERFSTASIVGHGKRLTDGVQSYRSRSRKKGALFHITLNDRSWPNPAGRGGIAGCHVENSAVAATGRNRPKADVVFPISNCRK